MWLNIDREETRRATSHLRAIHASISDNIGQEFFQALAESETEARAQYELYRSRQGN